MSKSNGSNGRFIKSFFNGVMLTTLFWLGCGAYGQVKEINLLNREIKSQRDMINEYVIKQD